MLIPASRERFVEFVDAQAIDVRRERLGDGRKSVTVRVRFDDGRELRGRDELGECLRVAHDRTEVDRDVGVHTGTGAERRSMRDATSATGMPKNAMCAMSEIASVDGDGR